MKALNLFLIFSGLVIISNLPSLAAPPYSSESNFLSYTIHSVKRNSADDSVTVKGVVKNISGDEVNLCTKAIECSYGHGFPIKIQDPKAKKEYGPLYVDNRRIVGSNHDGEALLGPGYELKFWVKIGAPPADVKSVILVMPGSATQIDDVTIE